MERKTDVKKQFVKILLIGFLLIFNLSIQHSGISISENSITKNGPFPNKLLDISFQESNPVTKLFNFFNPSEKGKQVTQLKLLPGGQSIGVTLQTKGVLIIGHAPIIDEQGKEVYPAKDSGVEIGDVILKVNGVNALNDLQVAKEINNQCKKNKKIELEIKRQEKILKKNIAPVYCSETSRFRIGLYIRDEAAGVGTLTFLHPQTMTFGALGHVVTDSDTKSQIELSGGKIVESMIYAIEKGKSGEPGEKIAAFAQESNFSGRINQNKSSGIFGIYEGRVENPFFKEPIPVALKSEIKTGKADIYTVIEGNKIQKFEIKIEKLMPYRSDNKNMVIRVTDPELLSKTGGIVQGMSGSPIIQNGKIVGAVTHVFINDSNRGYAVFIEKMLDESGLLSKSATNQNQITALGGFFLKRRNYFSVVEIM
ncbi:MAG: SpoIVB peptidase [Desulfitobacteriia bacterium]